MTSDTGNIPAATAVTERARQFLLYGGQTELAVQLSAALRTDGHEVFILTEDSAGAAAYPAITPKSLKSEGLPVCDAGGQVHRTDTLNRFDAVIFLAKDGFEADPLTDLQQERAATEQLCFSQIESMGPRALLVCSSAAVYDLDHSAPASPEGGAPLLISEAFPTKGNTSTQSHLLDLEARSQAMGTASGIPVVVLRTSNVLGGTRRRALLPQDSRLAMLIPGVQVDSFDYPEVTASYGGDRYASPFARLQDFIALDDVTAALRCAALALANSTLDSGTYNVGTGTVAAPALIERALTSDEPISLSRRAPLSAMEFGGLALDASRFGSALEWAASESIAPAIPHEVDSFYRTALQHFQLPAHQVKIAHEYLGSTMSADGMRIYGVVVAALRGGARFGQKPVGVIQKQEYRLTLPIFRTGSSIVITPYRLHVPLEDVGALPINSSVSVALESTDGRWHKRTLPYSILRRGRWFQTGKPHAFHDNKMSAYVRQSRTNRLFITVRKRLNTDELRMRALIRLTSALARVVPDRGILMYEKESMKYEESGKVVFERLVDMGRTDVRFILPRSMWHEVPPQYHRYLIDRHSFAHFFLFFNAKAIIGTTLPINAADSRTANRLIRLRLAKAKYKHVHLRHGVMYCVSLDSEQRKNLYSERGVAGSTAAKMVCSGELEARHFMDMAGFPRENLYICGVPKFDRAVLVPDPKLILIMPTWRPWEYNLVRTNPETAPYYQMLLTLYNAVPAHLREHARIMPHPLMREPLQETALGKLMWQDSYDNALQHGAIMITDYSSISYDAFYRGTNVIFWWKDKNECMVKYGGRLMLTEDTAFGPVCYDPACLTETIERLYQAPQDPVYRERYSRIVEFSDNGNTDRLIEFMLRDGII